MPQIVDQTHSKAKANGTQVPNDANMNAMIQHQARLLGDKEECERLAHREGEAVAVEERKLKTMPDSFAKRVKLDSLAHAKTHAAMVAKESRMLREAVRVEGEIINEAKSIRETRRMAQEMADGYEKEACEAKLEEDAAHLSIVQMEASKLMAAIEVRSWSRPLTLSQTLTTRPC